MRALLIMLLAAGCAPTRQAALRPATAQRWVAVLVAGDASIPVFDNATSHMADLLGAVGTPPAAIHRLSASPDMLVKPMIQIASKTRVLDAIASLHPQPGQACLVFMTSHGAHGPGIYLAPRTEFLTPEELDAALDSGCGAAPTVAIVSACYTGDFAQPPMARPNRVVLAADAADRPSFGCGAGQQLAYYDECLLRALQSLPNNWPDVAADTGRCVAALEKRGGEPASMPQTAIGAATAGLAVPG